MFGYWILENHGTFIGTWNRGTLITLMNYGKKIMLFYTFNALALPQTYVGYLTIHTVDDQQLTT